MSDVTVTPSGPEPPGRGSGWRWLDLPLRVAGGVVAFAGGGLGAAMALILLPLRLDLGFWVVRFPAAVVLAVVGNALLLWFARVATGTRWGVLAPAVAWFTVMLPALGTTSEGSRLMMPNDWVGLLTLFGGTIVLTVGAVMTIANPRRASDPPIRRSSDQVAGFDR